MPTLTLRSAAGISSEPDAKVVGVIVRSRTTAFRALASGRTSRVSDSIVRVVYPARRGSRTAIWPFVPGASDT